MSRVNLGKARFGENRVKGTYYQIDRFNYLVIRRKHIEKTRYLHSYIDSGC